MQYWGMTSTSVEYKKKQTRRVYYIRLFILFQLMHILILLVTGTWNKYLLQTFYLESIPIHRVNSELNKGLNNLNNCGALSLGLPQSPYIRKSDCNLYCFSIFSGKMECGRPNGHSDSMPSIFFFFKDGEPINNGLALSGVRFGL